MTQLATGTLLGSFRIESLVGIGGMGQVYRALDLKLHRHVALKLLPDQFASDPDRLARFQREAQILAALNHPHIAQLYGVEESAGLQALVMELVEGQSLADRLTNAAARPMTMNESLPIARQIADALDAAHEKGIVHRDLKPGNVMLTPDGRVKVLDFGLAKLASPDALEVNQTQSPTELTMAGTGVLLGTVAYMSPEQARGRPVDKRSDIWAFGCVLYEMVAGRPAFAAETVSDTLARILERTPDWMAVPTSTPDSIRHLLRRCLEKDPRRRLRDIGDARVDLEGTESDSSHPAPLSRPRRGMWLGIGVGTVGVLTAIAALALRPGPAAVKPVRMSVLPPAGTAFTWRDITEHPQFALSPDGTQLAFVAAAPGEPSRIWVRSLESGSSRPLNRTEGASGPFWSPDGREIAYRARGTLRKIAVEEGAVQDLAETAFDVSNGTWSNAGVVLFTSANGAALSRVSSSGGAVTAATKLDESRHETVHRFPQFLPDGRRYIVFVGSTTPANMGVHIGSIDSPQLRMLMPSGVNAVFAEPDSLLFERNGILTRQAIDLDAVTLVGEPMSLGDAVVGLRGPSYLPLSVGRTGTIAYWTGALTPSELRWFDRAGRPLGRLGSTGKRYDNPVLSRDGKRVVATLRENANSNEIWRFDVATGAATRMTFTRGVARFPIWSRDGQMIAFSAADEEGAQIFEKAASGAGEEVRLQGIGRHYALFPDDWSADGNWLLYDVASENAFDVWALDVRNRRAQPLLQGPENEVQPHLSPNGHWLAYASDETGTWEVYVRGFGENRGKWQVSMGGGSQPTWRGDGRELYYVGSDRRMFAVPIGGGPTFEHQAPQPLFETQIMPVLAPFRMGYAVSADGQRFLINTLQSNPEPAAITVVLNWNAHLQQ
jgi:Tol biopolymer transport system component